MYLGSGGKRRVLRRRSVHRKQLPSPSRPYTVDKVSLLDVRSRRRFPYDPKKRKEKRTGSRDRASKKSDAEGISLWTRPAVKICHTGCQSYPPSFRFWDLRDYVLKLLLFQAVFQLVRRMMCMHIFY
jgi:hypothetical protein